ncbi:unnamed protein product [marine sediment metagenome]|uniref:Uncharacterized protein n=1 Tax=marine sediment metagenome TaxID=412755 RepID=X1C4Q6_9ZZZZ
MIFDDYIQTVTQDRIVPKIFDTILGDNVIALKFLSKGQEWSGETLKVPFKYRKGVSGGSFDGFDRFSTERRNTRLNMLFYPTGYYQPVALMLLENYFFSFYTPGGAVGVG